MKALVRLAIFSFIVFLMSPAYGASNLNGVATYQDLGKEVFIAALYADDGSQDSIKNLAQDLKLEVRATSNITKRRWVNMWMQGIAINNRKDVFEAQAESLVNLFDSFKGGLKSGDNFTLNYSTDSGTRVDLNGVEIMSGLDKNFFGLFLQAWIGPVPPSSEFKNAILGTAAATAGLAGRLATISPAQSRIDDIAAWVAPEIEEIPEEVVEIAPPEPVPVVEEVVEEPEPMVEEVVEEIVEEELPEEEVIVSVESLIAQQEYTTSVVRKIYSSLKYPKRAINRDMEGTVRVQLQIMRDGQLQETLLSESSDHKLLNDAAMKAVNKAAPFEPIPEVVTEDQIEFSIPIVFRITQ